MEHMNAEMMMWRPKLIRLTQIANPDHDGGQTTPCYAHPECIETIQRHRAAFGKSGLSGEFHEYQDVTIVAMHGAKTLFVTESPDEVARLRDQALGHTEAARPTPLRNVT